MNCPNCGTGLVLTLAEVPLTATTAPEEPPHPASAPDTPQVAPSATSVNPNAVSPWKCPVHGTSRIQPAGAVLGASFMPDGTPIVSKAGKSYHAFLACGEFKCNEKPPR